MADLKLTRSFRADIDTVFAYVTRPEHLLEWWGPEGMHVPEGELDFTRPGPWWSVMQNDEGQRFKVSGQVTSVTPPNSVGFTWAWHDPDDKRGEESHVMISLTARADGGTDFVLWHRELVDEEAAANHNRGWTSSLRKLERMAGLAAG